MNQNQILAALREALESELPNAAAVRNLVQRALASPEARVNVAVLQLLVALAELDGGGA